MGVSGGEPSCWLDVEASALATSVAVMAPALTEAGPQKPENLISPLPSAGFLSAEQASQVCQNRQVLAKFIVSANVQPSKIDEQCLQGIPQDLIRDVINLKFPDSGLDSLSELIAAEKKNFKASNGAAIMNDSSIGDPADSMGFLRTVMGNESVDPTQDAATIGSCHSNKQLTKMQESIRKEQNALNNKLPEKQEDEAQETVEDGSLEQIMAFDSEIVPNSQDLGQNVEEILQVIKSMETAENTDNINSQRSEASNPQVQEDVSEIFPQGFTFDKDLLNAVDVDVIALCNDNISDSVEHQSVNKIADQVALNQQQVEKRQFEIERKCSFLIRRLRKLQSRWLGQHAAGEVSSVLRQAQASAKKGFIQDLESLGPKAGNVRNFPELSGNLNSFLQKVEKSCIAQNNSITVRQRNCFRYFGAGSKDSFTTSNSSRQPVFGVPQIKLSSEEVENVAGSLASKLKTVQNSYDSDCTASSSGGESCDEMQTFNNPHQQQLPIIKRASWKYAQERASIASRWTWLSAQISDLEFKIHHHNELQRQIRATKGAVILETPETVNGYSGPLPSPAIKCENELPASRTRPFLRSTFRKRKLVQVDRLHELSKRAARASTMRCDCNGSYAACVLCTGRTDPMLSQDPIEQLSVPERVALVDPGFHTVLSLNEEIPQSTHLDAIMKSVEWQQKVLRGVMRVPRLKDKDGTDRRNRKSSDPSAKYPPRVRKSSSSLVTARIKRKVLKGRTREKSVNRKRSVKNSYYEEDEEASVISNSSKHSSPVPSPLQLNSAGSTISNDKIGTKEKSSHGRLRQNSYDIDNIVIPYSVAAATRLEKLQYKEILIPKWRICDDQEVKNGAVQTPSQDSDFEDVSDETVVLRHERSEKEESKRFMSFMTMPYGTRMRHRRVDGRNDSGTNSPDPMSPQPSEFGGDTMSPVTSPPATPSNSLQDMDILQQSENQCKTNSLQNVLRNRTLSTVRSQKDESSLTSTNEEEVVKPIIVPYEPRIFPLTDEVYDKMLVDMPSGHWTPTFPICDSNEEKILDPEIYSQESDSTESALCDADGEDPNDPEWTVSESREIEKERIRPTAKR